VASPPGFEGKAWQSQPSGTLESPGNSVAANPPSSSTVGPAGPSLGDPVEAALAAGIVAATADRQWSVVALLTRELQARREARAGVVDLDMARRKRGTP